MSITLSQGLPANVVEIGNEVTQAKIDEINSGTLALQTWVTLGFAPKASPTFTGTVTIPAGASISGYLTTSSASSTYQTISGMTSYLTTSAASSTYQTIAGMSSYLTDAPSDGSEYVRKNGAWSVATGGGGGGISDAPSDGNLYARQNAAWTSFTIPTVPPASVTNIDLTGNFNGYSMGSGYYSFKYDSTANTLRMQDGVGFGTTVSTRGIDESVSSISITTTLDATHSNVLYVLTGFYTINIPLDSVYSFPIGKRFFICSPAGSIVDTAMTSVSLNGVVGGNYTLPNGVSTLIKVAADTWYIS